jgi:hypothetical protein
LGILLVMFADIRSTDEMVALLHGRPNAAAAE